MQPLLSIGIVLGRVGHLNVTFSVTVGVDEGVSW